MNRIENDLAPQPRPERQKERPRPATQREAVEQRLAEKGVLTRLGAARERLMGNMKARMANNT